MKKLILLLAVILLSGSCTTPNSKKENEEVIRPVEYKVIGTCHNVQKWVIEGHEYLVFSSKLASPPTVIHSESCPCHNN